VRLPTTQVTSYRKYNIYVQGEARLAWACVTTSNKRQPVNTVQGTSCVNVINQNMKTNYLAESFAQQHFFDRAEVFYNCQYISIYDRVRKCRQLLLLYNTCSSY